MDIFLISSSGQTFAGEKSVRSGTTLGELFHDLVGAGADHAHYAFLVNQRPECPEYQIQPGDRVVIAPRGARGAFQGIISLPQNDHEVELSSSLPGTCDAEVEEHRKLLAEIEKRAPDRARFRLMLKRFPAPDRWLDDDDDWTL